MYGAEFAEIYDAVYGLRGKDYERETEQLAGWIREYRPGAREVLDVACGTGGHLACLHKHFDHTEGLELSGDMLARARERLPGVPLHQGDMRDFDLGRRFDAVICMFGSIAHQDSADELRATLDRFARHLPEGGVVAFDPWWFPETFLEGYVAADVLRPDHRTIARVSYATRDGDCSRMDVHYTVADGATGVRHFTESYWHRVFPRETYERALREAGFAAEYIADVQQGRGLFIGVREGAQRP